MDRPFAAYSGEEPYIFVSYAHNDASAVFPELTSIKEHGFNIWYDEGIDPGTEWRQEIADAIEGCELFIYFITPNSVESDNCRKEVAFAQEEGRHVLAIHLEQTELPGALRLALSDRQAILKHETSADEYAARLIDGIRKYLPGNDEAIHVPIVAKQSLGKRIIRSKSLWVITGLLVIGTVLMSVEESRTWITQSAISLAFNAAAMFSSNQWKIESGIAVLPFTNMSNDPDNEYFSDGISEEILNALVKANRMNVIARTSSFAFKGKNQDIKEIARTLGVTHILEGSVRRANNKVRITAQLIDAATGAHLWSETYDRELLDVFAIQDEIAAKVVRQIGIQLMPGEDPTLGVASSRGTSSGEAYELYLRATHLLNSGNPFEIEKSIPLFEQSIALDREYGDAWVGFGTAYYLLGVAPYSLRFPDQVQPIAIDAFRTALNIDPTNARAMGLLGWVLMLQEYKWKEGAELMKQSVALNPLDAQIQVLYGWFLSNTRQPEATAVLEKAYRLNPLDPNVITVRSGQFLQSDRVLDAMALTETLLIQDREGYLSNAMAAFMAAPFRPNTAEQHLARARDIAGADHPMIRVVEWGIALGRRDRKLSKAIGDELFDRAQYTPISMNPLLPWGKDRIVEMWDIAIKHRQIMLVRALFEAKPYYLPEADWQRIKTLTRVAEADIGTVPRVGLLRTNNEQENVLSEAVSLTDEEWVLYVGDYQGADTAAAIERHENELIVYYDVGITRHLIPMGGHLFKRLDFKETFEFIVVDGEVTQVNRIQGQITYQLTKVR